MGNPSNRLRFTQGNAKLSKDVTIFSLPAGHRCPFARNCLSTVPRHGGRLRDGKDTTYRCFAASAEALRPNVRDIRWHNADLLAACKGRAGMAELIKGSLAPLTGFVRVHESGDFFSQDYFDAWLDAAVDRQKTRFYGYTKSLPYWVKRLDRIPDNLVLTASLGGRADRLIDEYGLRYARVVNSPEEAEALGLELDHDDGHAMNRGPSFALLLHGPQPAGSDAALALAALRKRGDWGYGKKADARRRA